MTCSEPASATTVVLAANTSHQHESLKDLNVSFKFQEAISPGGVSHTTSFMPLSWRCTILPGASQSRAAGSGVMPAATATVAVAKRSSIPMVVRRCSGNLESKPGLLDRKPPNCQICLLTTCLDYLRLQHLEVRGNTLKSKNPYWFIVASSANSSPTLCNLFYILQLHFKQIIASEKLSMFVRMIMKITLPIFTVNQILLL